MHGRCGFEARIPKTLNLMCEKSFFSMQALISRMNGQKCGPKLEDFMAMLKSLPDQDVYEVGCYCKARFAYLTLSCVH